MPGIIKSVEEITVYESPDGGRTIYVRKQNQQDRTLVHKDIRATDYDRWQEWREILVASRDNPELANLIERAEVYYKLLK